MELRELDLSKGERMTHPDFKPYPTQYLVKIGQGFYAGSFGFYSPQNKWSFMGGPWGSYDYNSPGTNNSNWKRVWEILETDEEKAQMSTHELLMSKGIGT